VSIPSSASPEAAGQPPATGGSRLDAVLRLLTEGGRVSGNMRQSAQGALANVPPEETIIDAYRCGIVSGVTKGEGVAVLTATRLAIFERRGLRSVDQRFQLSLAKPFSVEPGPRPTHLVLAAAGGRPVTVDFLDVARVESFREQLEMQRGAREEGWWSQAAIAWPGWLGSDPSWGYLGGDRNIPAPALKLRVNVGPAGIILGDIDGTTAPLAPWSVVSTLHVVSPEEGCQRAVGRGLLVSEPFAAAWRSEEWSAFLVLNYASGDQAFLGTTGYTESDLRGLLFRVAAAMPSTSLADEAPHSAKPAAVTLAANETPGVEPPAASTSAANAPYDLTTQLERLGALHREGILDDAEFSKAKATLLGG
jgi:hypothetical protein